MKLATIAPKKILSLLGLVALAAPLGLAPGCTGDGGFAGAPNRHGATESRQWMRQEDSD